MEALLSGPPGLLVNTCSLAPIPGVSQKVLDDALASVGPSGDIKKMLLSTPADIVMMVVTGEDKAAETGSVTVWVSWLSRVFLHIC